ncbi:helix-turn-helix domain-containing protein [Pedobacter caeni]|uniref:Helix-turn-helix n=1 Tax=Pedobacter caeni TaxID=288992 RepID=A0A1M5PP22_9SPHI|nr:helix-turn-helix transcriptional regulator [Pedobacter caeni]SHH03431.1 Helix-turn-helix [Pedobacter caeni]
MSEKLRNARREYAEQLKAYRKKVNISQEDFALALEIYQPYIASIEGGSLSIGLDKQEDIATCFGVKYYQLADPEFPIPSREELWKSIEAYVKAAGIEVGYMQNKAPGLASYMDELLQSDFFEEWKLINEIVAELKERFGLEVVSTRVSDILHQRPRRLLVEVKKAPKGNFNLYRLMK